MTRTADAPHSREVATLVYAVFVAGLCSIVYELLIATTVVYFLGDSVRYFSLTIGLYMAAMGVGAYASKLVGGELLRPFLAAEVALGGLGGLAIPLLYAAHAWSDHFLLAYGGLTLAIGFLIGLEIPFLTRLLEQYGSLRVNIAHVLSLDYLGALVATVAFPLLLLPWFGLFRTGLVFGLANMSLGLLLIWVFPHRLGRRVRAWGIGVSLVLVAVIGVGLWFAQGLLAAWNAGLYEARVVHTERTRHQRITLTQWRDDLRLYLDGNLQFSSRDEYRYHEALVHVPLANAPRPVHSVLVLGGGDGLAVRELLRSPTVRRVTVVDLDARMLALAREAPRLTALNDNALADPRVTVRAAEAFAFLRETAARFDLIVLDLPDPNNTDLARLYTRPFYQLVRRRLRPGGVMVAQATSPYFALAAFRGVVATVETAFSEVRAYHALVPSFGDWGFVMATDRPWHTPPRSLPAGLRFVTAEMMPGLFVFPADRRPEGGAVSTLDRPVILRDYLAGWRAWH